RFVPFGFYGDVIEAMDATHIEIPSYDEEFAKEVQERNANDEAVNEATAQGKVVSIAAGAARQASGSLLQPQESIPAQETVLGAERFQTSAGQDSPQTPKLPPTPEMERTGAMGAAWK